MQRLLPNTSCEEVVPGYCDAFQAYILAGLSRPSSVGPISTARSTTSWPSKYRLVLVSVGLVSMFVQVSVADVVAWKEMGIVLEHLTPQKSKRGHYTNQWD